MKNYVFFIDKCNRRSFYLADSLSCEGYTARDYKAADNVPHEGIPVYVFSPAKTLSEHELDALPDGAIVFAGKTECADTMSRKNIKLFSLLLDDSYCILNAAITAEGALSLAISSTDYAIFDCRVLVLGYGRLGKKVAGLLRTVGAAVTVATYDIREYHVSSAVQDTTFMREFVSRLSDYDIIMNTIPANILSAEDVSAIKDGALYIELASKPYGVRPELMQGVDVTYILASALPDKYSPRTAGHALKNCVMRKLQELTSNTDNQGE